MTTTAQDLDHLHELVAAALGGSADELDDGDDLIMLGLDSLAMIRISAHWRHRTGHDLPLAELSGTPTLRAWKDLVARHAALDPTDTSAAASASPPASDDADPAFALATMQHAYWAGRSSAQPRGGVAAHLYAEFEGTAIDPERLRHAVDALLARHPSLRTRVGVDGRQAVMPSPGVPVFAVVDLREDGDVEARLNTIRDAKTHQLLDIDQGQLIDVTLTLLPGGRSRLHLDVDMIAADAMSYRTILTDLARFSAQAPLDPAELGYDYRSYLRDHQLSTAAARERDASWWGAQLDDYPSAPALPLVAEAEASDPHAMIRLERTLTGPERDALYRRAHAHGVTPAAVLATAFAAAVGRCSSTRRFLLNLPLFDREPLHEHVDRMVGDFSNSVLIDAEHDPGIPFVERARRFQRQLHECASHSGFRGLDVLRELGRRAGEPALAPIVYTSGLSLGELFAPEVTAAFGAPVWIISQGPQVVLDAQVVELHGGLLVNWDVRRDAFPPGFIAAMFAGFRGIIDALVTDEDAWTTALMIPLDAGQSAARARLTSRGAHEPRTLHDAFFALARTQPDAPAVHASGGTLSYGMLAEQAFRVASALARAGVRAGDTVAINVARGPAQVPLVLGVLALGATYLPIADTQPRTRRDVILRRGQARAVILDLPGEVPDGLTPLTVHEALHHRLEITEPAASTPEDVAYVLFTSGSTGEPKGVEVQHRAAAHTIDAIGAHYGLDADTRTLGVAVLEFDLSVFDLFAPLSLGGSLIALTAAEANDAVAWARLARRHRVSVLNAAPSVLRMLFDVSSADDLGALDVVISGGDWVTTDLARRLRELAPHARFAGLGGTTETAIHSTVCDVPDVVPAHWRSVPYGRPLPGVRCRVVTEAVEDAPDWVVGELWIGGRGVARGYRGDPERTADRFVDWDGERWYRTGDLARYLPDGTLEFLGRADHQVKLRGHRVELGEVEAALRELEPVDQAVAVAHDGRLLAAVTAPVAAAQDLLDQLRQRLAPVMIPDSLVVLDALPITRNGKLDRARIAELARDEEDGTAEPANDLEAALLSITEEVLPALRGVDTDFFRAGGDSVLATTAVAQIRSLLDVTTLTLGDMLAARNVHQLAALLIEREPDPARLEVIAGLYLEVLAEEAEEAAS